MVERRTIVFEHELLAGLAHPAFDARGAKDGPTLCLLGGIHGCEYSSIAAVTRFMNELDTTQLAGRIVAVPVVSMQSFERRSAFVVPEDGKNLNRCFPGTLDGTYTDVLARSIFDELIAPSDVLIDLHGGDQAEGLEPFALYVESDVGDRARALAVAFGLPYVVREPARAGALGGTTAAAAAAAGIPAVIAEAGGRGLLEGSSGRVARRRRPQRPSPARDAAGSSPSRRGRSRRWCGRSSGSGPRRRAGGTRSSRRATRSRRADSSAGSAISGETCSRRSPLPATVLSSSSRRVPLSPPMASCSGSVRI